MSKHTPGPWKIINGEICGSEPQDFGDHNEQANKERIVECVNAMDGIRQPIEFMDCVLDTLQKVKTMMEIKITQNLREAIYDDVCATIEDLEQNKNLPCNNV